MSKIIDVSQWGEFKLGKIVNKKNGSKVGNGIFDIVNSTAYHGKDISETNDEDGLNYVTRSKFNNGVKCKVVRKSEYEINPAGTISFGAENANFFYQEEEYITGNKMYYIDTSNISKYACRFIQSILERTFTANYSFSDGMIPERIYDKLIKLPVTKENLPDFDYMDSYMRNLEDSVSASLTALQSAQKHKNQNVNTANWKEFRIGDLFEQERGKEKAPKQNADGDCPLIQETNTNNGFDRYVTPTKVFKGNAITVSINYAQNVFYQKDDFCASVNIAILRNDHLNEYSGRFICTVLSSCHKKYDYVNKISKDKLNDEFIKLPAKNDETPDYKYMEQCMKTIDVISAKKISSLCDQILNNN